MPQELAELNRRNMLKLTGSSTALLLGGSASAATARNLQEGSSMQLAQKWHKVFPKSDRVDHQKVAFTNRYGITLVGDVYLPKNRVSGRLPALAVSGPFGAVKEQSSGLYAQTMAERGFAALAFDESMTR